ncbi:hypothetical protein XM38_010660 [Halomicronema hongdechloris C2206]|uniref:Uncharacterized protein n=1 Tax=Halomicronema hongdechloris C2206 TaxID=1641165 RepID=A0A1Z3HIP5_9CYAN|nr:hypothetical protein [Halomicronema hongdechloris]ASC70136.1 hypothetical protein XM38_010660 [Halomicronema hongdechloris C2206]
MKRHQKLLTLLVPLGLIGAIATVAIAQDPASQETFPVQMTTTHVETHLSQGDVQPITESAATLFTTHHQGATFSLRTDNLEMRHAYTAWWVVVNRPYRKLSL